MNTEIISQIANVADLVLQLEGILVALATIIFGKQAVSSYQQNKYRMTLHSAIETALGLVKAQGLDVFSADGMAKATDYVLTTGAGDAIKGIMKGANAAAIESQVQDMIRAKAAATAFTSTTADTAAPDTTTATTSDTADNTTVEDAVVMTSAAS